MSFSTSTRTALDRVRTVVDATRAALANPEDTAQVFRIAEAMAFGTPERMRRRFAADADGARLLAGRDDLLAILRDRARLEALPAGSLGRAYLAFLDAEGISADGLVEASIEGTRAAHDDDDSDLGYVRRRMRDSHDLWHTVTGYQGDLLGEASLLAFTFAQTGHPGIGFLAGLGAVMTQSREARRLIVDGFRRGRRATWLPARDWANLLARPLDEVRRQLGVSAPPVYTPVRQTPWAARAAMARA
jgi:ubiquinone biosynthesis protein COQ4